VKTKFFLVLGAVVLLLGLASAGYQLSTPAYTFQTNYNSSSHLTGWINISFTNQSINESFNDSLGNSINLSSILALNPLYNYTLNNITQEVDSDFDRLYFDNASFIMPSTEGTYTYKILFGNSEIAKIKINIDAVKILANKTLQEKLDQLNKIKQDISGLDSFVKTEVSSRLNLSGIETQLNSMQTNFDNYSESEYSELINNLTSIQIPLSVNVNAQGDNVQFIADKNAINLDVLKSITGENYTSGNEDNYANSILYWTEQNVQPKISYKSIEANYGDSTNHLISYFEFSFGKAPPQGTYFIVKDMTNMKFKGDYSATDEGGYSYFDLYNNQNRIAFATTEDVDILNIPAFISPAFSSLDMTGNIDYTDANAQKKVSKWTLFILILIGILIVGGIAYTITQTWYAKKYENYLFKNRNNLYNLINYINNSKEKGINESDIIRNLKRAKWKNEQINYVMKKYAGKRTGMYELPIIRIFKKKEQGN